MEAQLIAKKQEQRPTNEMLLLTTFTIPSRLFVIFISLSLSYCNLDEKTSPRFCCSTHPLFWPHSQLQRPHELKLRKVYLSCLESSRFLEIPCNLNSRSMLKSLVSENYQVGQNKEQLFLPKWRLLWATDDL